MGLGQMFQTCKVPDWILAVLPILKVVDYIIIAKLYTQNRRRVVIALVSSISAYDSP